MQSVYRLASDPAFGGRVVFVDDYDLHVAHYLVQGCDVWLNTPRKPLEASGTSGMKAALNGTVNVSIGDGWWAEGYSGSNGFLIDPGIETGDHDAMDAADAGALYRLLEEQIVPAFYERDEQDVPRRWVGLIKEAIRTVGAALLHPPDGQGIRRADVRAGDGPAPLSPVSRGFLGAAGGGGDGRGKMVGCRNVRPPNHAARSAVPRTSPSPGARRRYCRDCWDKKIAVEEIVAREFALKRYIRAHSAEKYLVYHSTAEAPLRPARRRR